MFFRPPTNAADEVIWDGTAGGAPVPADRVGSCGFDQELDDLTCGDDYVINDARRSVRTEIPDVVQQVRILTVSDPMPHDVVVFGNSFPDGALETITETILEVSDSDPDLLQQVFDPYGWSGVFEALSLDFETLTAYLAAAGYGLDDLRGSSG
jgi:hypothetical protein